MQSRIGRRAVLGGLAAPFTALPVQARPPFKLRGDPKPLLSPPIRDGAGNTLVLEDFAGKVVLLNVWATWCPPCREEMPMLDQLQARLGGPDFLVLALCIDEDGIDRGRRFYDEIGIINLSLFWAEPLRAQLAFAVIGLPTTLLVNRRSQELARLQGPFSWVSEDALRQIGDLLKA